MTPDALISIGGRSSILDPNDDDNTKNGKKLDVGLNSRTGNLDEQHCLNGLG